MNVSVVKIDASVAGRPARASCDALYRNQQYAVYPSVERRRECKTPWVLWIHLTCVIAGIRRFPGNLFPAIQSDTRFPVIRWRGSQRSV